MKKVKIEKTVEGMQAISEIMLAGCTIRLNITRAPDGSLLGSQLLLVRDEETQHLTEGDWFVIFAGSTFILDDGELSKEIS